MCANIDVDQAAALLLCSYEAARRGGRRRRSHGVPARGGGGRTTTTSSRERWTLTDSPGIAAAVGDALDAAGITIDDVARFDLYSCFPSAVQVAMRALRLEPDDPRPLTVTGGLGFAGGPVNNYPAHAIARMVEVLRADPASFGCTTALGWYISKHATGIWSATPPAHGFRRVETGAQHRRASTRSPAGSRPAWSMAKPCSRPPP